MAADNILFFRYIFELESGEKKVFTINLNDKTLDLILTEEDSDKPDWTKLEVDKCPNCPFSEKAMEYCPVAVNISDLIYTFSDSKSYEKAKITIETEARSYFKETEINRGISSILGIYMTTSGCPVMGRLKPMVKFHLPFATDEETSYRALSMFLVGQYFAKQTGQEPDLDISNLKKIYEEIEKVNYAFSRRLQGATKLDANLNALVLLDTYAKLIMWEIDDSSIKDLGEMYIGDIP